jgi:hypothetical protein
MNFAAAISWAEECILFTDPSSKLKISKKHLTNLSMIHIRLSYTRDLKFCSFVSSTLSSFFLYKSRLTRSTVYLYFLHGIHDITMMHIKKIAN